MNFIEIYYLKFHFYITNNSEPEFGLVENWGENTKEDKYKRQSIILHGFSAYVISKRFPTIKYIWTSPSRQMIKIFRNHINYYKKQFNPDLNIDNVILLGSIKPVEYADKEVRYDRLILSLGTPMYIQIEYLASVFETILTTPNVIYINYE